MLKASSQLEPARLNRCLAKCWDLTPGDMVNQFVKIVGLGACRMQVSQHHWALMLPDGSAGMAELPSREPRMTSSLHAQ